MIFSHHVEKDVVQTKFAAAAAPTRDRDPFCRGGASRESLWNTKWLNFLS